MFILCFNISFSCTFYFSREFCPSPSLYLTIYFVCLLPIRVSFYFNVLSYYLLVTIVRLIKFVYEVVPLCMFSFSLPRPVTEPVLSVRVTGAVRAKSAATCTPSHKKESRATREENL